MSELSLIENGLQSVGPSTVESITRGEIDVQISTAHRFPRSMQKFRSRGEDMVSMDQETAASCIFRRPVGKKQEGGRWVQAFAEGMSVRMAEIVGACYGNLRVGSMLVEQTDRYVKARGFAHDLETNFAAAVEVVEATIDKDGNPISERMRVVIAKAALAKARRDATFTVVPRALCKPLEAKAREVAIGSGKTLDQRRAAVVEWINRIGIDPARVYASMGAKGPADLGSEQLETLTGLRTAIKDGDTTADEAFPDVAQKPDFGKALTGESATDTDPAPRTRGKKASDGRATPLETLQNLCKSCGISENALMQYLYRVEMAEGCATLAEVPEPEVFQVVENWETVVAKIKEGDLL